MMGFASQRIATLRRSMGHRSFAQRIGSSYLHTCLHAQLFGLRHSLANHARNASRWQFFPPPSTLSPSAPPGLTFLGTTIHYILLIASLRTRFHMHLATSWRAQGRSRSGDLWLSRAGRCRIFYRPLVAGARVIDLLFCYLKTVTSSAST